jgi:hypothetical protein
VTSVTGDEGWSQSVDGVVGWAFPSEVDRAPVVGTDVRVCGPGGACEVASLGGDVTQYVVGALAEGETRVEVRRRDSASNTGEYSQAVVLRRDRTPPAVSASGPPAQVSAGDFMVLSAQCSDASSGVAQLDAEWRVDGGAWQGYGGAVRAQAGRTYEFRTRAIDRAGLTSPYVAFSSTSPAVVERPGAALQDPRLVIRKARRKGRYLVLSGTTAKGVTARITVKVKPRGTQRTVRRPVRPRDGRWRLRVRVPATKARRASVKATLPAAGGFRAGAAARVARLQR